MLLWRVKPILGLLVLLAWPCLGLGGRVEASLALAPSALVPERSQSGRTLAASYSAYLDNSNNLAASVPAGTLIGSGGPVTISSPNGNTNMSDTQLVTASAPYTLTLQFQAVLNNAGSNVVGQRNVFDMDGGVRVEAVPAPAGIMLLLAGAPVLGLGAWLRRRRKPTEA